MVEWKKLGTLSDIGTGSNNREDACENGLYPFYVRSKEVLRINSYLYDEEAILIPGEGGVGEIFHYVNGKYGLHQRTYRVHPILKIVKGKYLYYYLYENFGKYINQKSFKSTAASIRKPMLLDFPVAIPSLPEQTRIVGILDTFTASIENLKEQIAERRKQYEHYRDQLLDLEGKEGVEMKTLGEVCLKTKNIKWKSEPEENSYFYIDLSSVNIDLNNITDTTEINKDSAPSRAQQIVKIDDILLGTTRPTLKRYCQVPMQYDNQICSTGYCVFRANTAIVLSRWIFHNIGNGRFWDYCEQKQQGAGYPCLSNSDAFSYSIPVPSLEEQQRIVSILDTFEASIQNLEAQLKEREKQYEYYRNKLLTFE